MAEKLDAGQKHMMRLIGRDADADGWVPVSAPLLPIAKKTLPPDLATIESVGDDGRGRAKLTPLGQSLLVAMEWL